MWPQSQNRECSDLEWGRGTEKEWEEEAGYGCNFRGYLVKCCTKVHSSIIYNGPKAGTDVPINEWMDKQNVASTGNGILSSHKKERNSDTCCRMNAPRRHRAQWNKPDAKGQILHEPICMRYLERSVTFVETESGMQVTKGWGEEGMGDSVMSPSFCEEWWKSSENAAWWWSHNIVNAPNATVLYT